MSALEKIEMTPSPEAELVRQIEELIRKLASGDADEGDLQLLQELQRKRVEMMRPKVFKKHITA
jgi:hypothetical protein